jgi:hypothetical protein
MLFHKARVGLNDDGDLGTKPLYVSRNCKIPLEVNYESRIETYYYFSYGDMVAKLGGLKSAIEPFINLMVPIIAILFLH